MPVYCLRLPNDLLHALAISSECRARKRRGIHRTAITHTCRTSNKVRRLRRAGAAVEGTHVTMQEIPTTGQQESARREPLRVQLIAREVLTFIRPSLPSTIETRCDIDPRCGSVLANRVEIRRILMNLCTNAYHAMREYGGVLRVIVTEARLDAGPTAERSNLRAGRYAKLIVEDTGHGMDEGILHRIFEPDFTTKSGGDGTGMGLAIVKQTVNDLEGVISVQSRPEDGTRFEVLLPLCEDSEQQEKA